MNANKSAGIANANLATAPKIASATVARATGLLTVSITGVTDGQVVSVYAGTAQGRVYLGRAVAVGTSASFTMSRIDQQTAGVSAQVFAGAVITATRSSTGGSGQTSPFATGFAARAV